MAKAPAPLRVIPNPYRVLDGDGEPACVVYRRDAKRHVGAARDPARSTFDDKTHVHSPKYTFSEEVEVLPNTREFRRNLVDHELLPADAATAALAGIPFVPMAEALDHERNRAIAAHVAAYGEPPAFAKETA